MGLLFSKRNTVKLVHVETDATDVENQIQQLTKFNACLTYENDFLKQQLERCTQLSLNLEERVDLENSFWDLCNDTDYKTDHNNYINNFYLNST